MDSKLIDSFRMKNHQKFKANHNYMDAKRMKSKVRLPSLGANMYIITTSTRLLQKGWLMIYIILKLTTSKVQILL